MLNELSIRNCLKPTGSPDPLYRNFDMAKIRFPALQSLPYTREVTLSIPARAFLHALDMASRGCRLQFSSNSFVSSLSSTSLMAAWLVATLSLRLDFMHAAICVFVVSTVKLLHKACAVARSSMTVTMWSA